MAKVIEVLNNTGGDFPTAYPVSLNVKSGTEQSIIPGALVIVDGSNAGYVKAAPDGASTSDLVVGVADSLSSETTTADGTVQVMTAPNLLVSIKAKTPANLVASMLYSAKYVLDVTSGNYTLDQGTTANGIFRLWSYDNTTQGNCLATINCTAL